MWEAFKWEGMMKQVVNMITTSPARNVTLVTEDVKWLEAHSIILKASLHTLLPGAHRHLQKLAYALLHKLQAISWKKTLHPMHNVYFVQYIYIATENQTS